MFLVFLLLFGLSISAETIHVSGDVNGIWTADSVLVEDNIVVNENDTLFISSGVYVEFQGYYQLEVFGSIIAEGSENDSIYFTICDTAGFNDGDTLTGCWKGLILKDNYPYQDRDKSMISYCNIEHVNSEAGLLVEDFNDLEMKNSRVSNNYGTGLKKLNNHPFNESEIYLDRCVFSRNIAEENGGISIDEVDSLIISNCQVMHNSGRGIFARADSIKLERNTISHNYADSRAGLSLNGLYIYLEYNEISNNFAENRYGGVGIGAINVYFSNNIITGNIADSHGGGSISASGESLIMINNEITYNNTSGIWVLNSNGGIVSDNLIAYNMGNGLSCWGDTLLVVQNNMIFNNDGSGLYMIGGGGNIALKNLICNNTTSNYGGGLSLKYEDNLKVIGNTIFNNVASIDGGGVSLEQYSSLRDYSILFANNIIYFNEGNYVESSVYFENEHVMPQFYYNDICLGVNSFTGGWDGNYPNYLYLNNIAELPVFIDPTIYAGIEYDALEADWHLQEISPCIDTGTPTGWILLDSTITINDLLGYEPIGDAYDIGAYEFDLSFVSSDFLISKSNQVFLSNYPNPFNPITNITFDLSESGKVKLDIYNIKGQLIKTLVNEEMNAGSHSIVWNGKNCYNEDVSSGIYFYRLEVNEQITAKKMILLK